MITLESFMTGSSYQLAWYEKDFRQLILRYDDSVSIYIHQKMTERGPLFCPLQSHVPDMVKLAGVFYYLFLSEVPGR